jgi:hypothetical protein
MKLRFPVLAALLVATMSGTVFAQGALFTGIGIPKTVTATGQTEVIGSVMASLTLGTSDGGNLLINLSPLQITNTSASDIQVAATGITAGATTIDTLNSLVRVPINAGAIAGSIRVDGIRVAVAGTGITSFNAQLSWENSLNLFTSGTTVPVINSVQSGLLADTITDRFVIFNGQIFKNSSSITVHEGYAAAFSNSTGYGQTGPTKIKIRVTDFASNLQMTFPATVTTTDSAATLNILEGRPVVLPRDNGNTEVTYAFSGVSGSDSIVESFKIPFTVSLTGVPSLVQPTFEVTLAPIGAAVPNSSNPATDVPRYAEDEILVQAGTSRTITKILYWTGADASVPAQVNLLNASSNAANLTIDALDASGQPVSGNGITNPVKLSLSANQSLVRSLSGLFGTAAGISTVRIQSTNSSLLATVVLSGTGKTVSVPFISQSIFSPFIPVVGENGTVQLFNPNSSATAGTLTLRSEDGGTVSSAPLSLAPLASASVSLSTLFNSPTRGYVSGSFTLPVVVFESFGTGASNLLAIEPAAAVSSLYIPFFAVGDGYQTDINLLNVSDQGFTVQAQMFNSTGVASGTLVTLTFAPNQQIALPLEQLFSQVPSSGYIRFDVPQLMKGFFAFYPGVSGHARIRTAQGGSTAIPLSQFALQDSFVLGAGTSSSESQGIALVNPGTSSVNVSLQVLSSTGAVQSAASVTLNAGQILSELTTQLFTSGVPAQSVVRVTASSPIVAAVVTASNSNDALRSLPIVR